MAKKKVYDTIQVDFSFCKTCKNYNTPSHLQPCQGCLKHRFIRSEKPIPTGWRKK